MSTRAGTHPSLGAYEELSLGVEGGALAVQYFAAADAFVFQRRPSSDGEGGEPLAARWPSFSIGDQPANHTRCLGWA